MKLKELDGVISISCGENYTSRGLGYNFGITVRFTTRAAESAYQTHPDHVQFRDAYLKPLFMPDVESPILVIDYDFR